jgi:hypothetical protein
VSDFEEQSERGIVKKTRSFPGIFKRCTMCGVEWATKDEFLHDREIHLNGYQWNRKKFRSGEGFAGLLVFTHRKAHCGTSLAIAATKFKADAFPEDFDELEVQPQTQPRR